MTDLPDGVTNAMFEQFVDGSPYSDSCPEVLAELAEIRKNCDYSEIMENLFTGQEFTDLVNQSILAEYDTSENREIVQDTIKFVIGRRVAAEVYIYLKQHEAEHLAEAHARAAAKRGAR